MNFIWKLFDFTEELITVTINCIGLAIVLAIALGIVATIGRLIWLIWA